MNRVRGVEGELQRDHAAVGVTHHVRARYAKLLHEGVAVRCLLRDAQRFLRVGAAGEPAPVVQDQLIPFRQRRLRQERRESVCEDRAVHQHDWLSGTSDLVFQHLAIDLCSVHTWAPIKEERCVDDIGRLLLPPASSAGLVHPDPIP